MTRVRPFGLLLVALVVAACTGAPVLANPPVVRPVPSATPAPPSPAPDPQPIALPADDGTHHRLTEWWYYTGHLAADDGRRFGFEFVIFRAERGAFPVTWASHLALTDEAGRRFLYAQRSEIGPQVDRTSAAGGGASLALALTGFDPTSPAPSEPRTPWTMARSAGGARLGASAAADEVAVGGDGRARASFGLDLTVADARAVLHGADGWVDFGPAGGSYYYSRTRQPTSGTLTLDGRVLAVSGISWFDHQWGNFISVGGGGWDWFAVNLDDRTDLTLSLVRAADGSYPLVYGTLVRPDGSVVHLDRSAFTVDVGGHWTSPGTGATYPSGWRIRVPAEDLEIALNPTVADQELDTRATTGVVYWEGSQVVRAMRDGRALGGAAYVELTGYAGS